MIEGETCPRVKRALRTFGEVFFCRPDNDNVPSDAAAPPDAGSAFIPGRAPGGGGTTFACPFTVPRMGIMALHGVILPGPLNFIVAIRRPGVLSLEKLGAKRMSSCI